MRGRFELRKSILKHLSYANIASTLALVFAMAGGAIAANHYLINSTRQINPVVLKKLKGASGKPGARGATGATGAAGSPGREGPAGKAGDTGSSDGYESFTKRVGDIPNGGLTVLGNLSVPAGSYLVSAKMWGGKQRLGTGASHLRTVEQRDRRQRLQPCDCRADRSDAVQRAGDAVAATSCNAENGRRLVDRVRHESRGSRSRRLEHAGGLRRFAVGSAGEVAGDGGSDSMPSSCSAAAL